MREIIMKITFVERQLITTETVKKIQGWRVLEKKMTNYVTIEGGFQSNRLYTIYFLMETDNFGNVNLENVLHHDQFMDYQLFNNNNVYYVLMKVCSYNKLAIDKALDNMRLLQNNEVINFIKSDISLEFSAGSLTLTLISEFIDRVADFE